MGYEFSLLSTNALRVMVSDMVRHGPVQQDADFFKHLVNEIARREKEARRS